MYSFKILSIHFPGLICFEDDEDKLNQSAKEALSHIWLLKRYGNKAHPSDIEFFIIVSLPEDAADTIWRSIDLLILAVKSYLDEVD